jgi:hypothetical protein
VTDSLRDPATLTGLKKIEGMKLEVPDIKKKYLSLERVRNVDSIVIKLHILNEVNVMTNAKSNINEKEERRFPFQLTVNFTLDEQIITVAIKRNPRKVELKIDSDGNIHIDKENNPEVYDWAVNG